MRFLPSFLKPFIDQNVFPFATKTFKYFKPVYIFLGYEAFRRADPSRFTLSFASILFNLGKFPEASLLYKKVLTKRLNLVIARTDLVDQLTKLKQKNLITDEEFLNNSDEYLNSEPSMESLNTFITFLWQLGYENQAKKVIKKASELSLINNESAYRPHDIVEISNVSTANLISAKLLLAARKFDFNLPTCVNPRRNSHPSRHTVNVPEIVHYKLKNAYVKPGYTLFIDDNYIIYEPAADPRNNLVAGQWQYILGSKYLPNQILSKYPPTAEEHLDSAILLSGRCSNNYFHWLIEYLPRVLMLQNTENYPYLIEKNLPPPLLESLKIFLPKDAKMIFYDHTKTLRFKNLLVPSLPIYHPDNFDIPYWQGAAVSREHIQFLIQTIQSAMGPKWNIIRPERKVCISRKNYQGRAIANQKEIEDYLQQLGFEIVYPETMSFLEQISLFRSAKVVIGATGAAFANSIFCQNGSLIFNFIADHNQDYCMFSNLAQSVGVKYYLILGTALKDKALFPHKANFTHAPYKVPLNDFKNQFEAKLRDEGLLT